MNLIARQDGLQVFHFLLYPQPQFYLPILFVDVLLYHDRIQFAIIDTSSIRLNKSLPDFYSNQIKQIQSYFSVQSSLPTWGRKFLSHFCLNRTPVNNDESKLLIDYVCSLTRLHIEVASTTNPVVFGSNFKIKEIIMSHCRFCHDQLKNNRLRLILFSSFGKNKTNMYMQDFMFDILNI